LDDGLQTGVAGLRPEDGWPLAVGIEGRAAKLKCLGNAIVPAVAAEFIKAAMALKNTSVENALTTEKVR
jgi:hypothetical protein